MQSRLIGAVYSNADVFGIQALDNLEHIRSEVDKVCFDRIYSLDYLNEYIKDPNYAKLIEQRFINDFFNERYNLDYKKFIQRSIPVDSDTINMGYDGYVAGHLYNSSVKKVCIPDIERFNDIHIRIHEFSHYINFSKRPKMYYNYLLSELPSLFIQKLFVDYAIEHDYFSNQGDINEYYYLDSLLRYVYSPSFSFNELKEEGEVEVSYDELMNYLLYFLGFVFSKRLYDIYLDEGNKFLKRYKGIYTGDSVDAILEHYNINLYDDKTIDSTLKLVRRLQKEDSYDK